MNQKVSKLILILSLSLSQNLLADAFDRIVTDQQFTTPEGLTTFLNAYDEVLNRAVNQSGGTYFRLKNAYARSASTDLNTIHTEVASRRTDNARDFKEVVAILLGSRSDLRTKFDKTLYAYNSCYDNGGKNLNWKIAKAIAFGESRFNTTAGVCDFENPQGRRILSFFNPLEEILAPRGRGRMRCRTSQNYVGLYQMTNRYCASAFNNPVNRSLPQSFQYDCEAPIARALVDTNTFVAATQLTKYALKVEQYCPNADIRTKIALLYVGHNDGAGALYRLLGMNDENQAARCDIRSMWIGLKDYYENVSRISVKNGLLKLKYGLSHIYPYAYALGVQSLFVDATPASITQRICPLYHGQRVYEALP